MKARGCTCPVRVSHACAQPHTHTCNCAFALAHVCVHELACAWTRVHCCACTPPRVHACNCVFALVRVCVSAPTCVRRLMCTPTCVCTNLRVHKLVCAWICVSTDLFVHRFVCARTRVHGLVCMQGPGFTGCTAVHAQGRPARLCSCGARRGPARVQAPWRARVPRVRACARSSPGFRSGWDRRHSRPGSPSRAGSAPPPPDLAERLPGAPRLLPGRAAPAGLRQLAPASPGRSGSAAGEVLGKEGGRGGRPVPSRARDPPWMCRCSPAPSRSREKGERGPAGAARR